MHDADIYTCLDEYLYISHVSPDKFHLPTQISISDVVEQSIPYQVVYIPHDVLGTKLETCNDALFSIPIKHQVIESQW